MRIEVLAFLLLLVVVPKQRSMKRLQESARTLVI